LGTRQTVATGTTRATYATGDGAIVRVSGTIGQNNAVSTDARGTCRSAVRCACSTCAAHATLDVAGGGDVSGAASDLECDATCAASTCGSSGCHGIAARTTVTTGEWIDQILRDPGSGDGSKATLTTTARTTRASAVAATASIATSVGIESCDRRRVDAMCTATATTTTAAFGSGTTTDDGRLTIAAIAT
jgi:hypothetical protein